MTKLRPPGSIDSALARIAGHLPGGWTDMAAYTDRREGLVRAWGDPERREQIPLLDALLLDRAFREAEGPGAPLLEFYAARLDPDGIFLTGNDIALASHAACVIRECSEASAALVETAQAAATPAQRDKAVREVREAIEALQSALTLLGGIQAVENVITLREQRATGPP